MNRVVSNTHHAGDGDGDSSEYSSDGDDYDPREFSSSAWSRSRMVKQKQPVMSSVHDGSQTTPFVIDSADRDIMSEGLFCFRIKCTPGQEQATEAGNEPVSFSESRGCTLLSNITEISAIHCTAIVMPKYSHLNTIKHKGEVVPYESSDELTASLDIMPATLATNARIRKAFNMFVPEGYESASYFKYSPVMPTLRFITPINYMHGMQWSLNPYGSVQQKCVDSSATASGNERAVRSPDVLAINSAVYSITDETLTFTTVEEIDSNFLRAGSVVSVHGFRLPDSNGGAEYSGGELNFHRFLNELMVPSSHHVVVATSDDLRSFQIDFDVSDTELVDSGIDNEGVLDVVKSPFYILIQSMQYRVYFQIEHTIHKLQSQTSEH
jgi:hypothetical protein